MMLVLVREWIWDILERGLEAGGCEALGCLVLNYPMDYKNECSYSQIPVTGV